jgi:hypothetical protein
VRNFLDASFRTVLVLVVQLTLLILHGAMVEDVVDLHPNLNLGIVTEQDIGCPTVHAKSFRVPGIWLSDCMGQL